MQAFVTFEIMTPDLENLVGLAQTSSSVERGSHIKFCKNFRIDTDKAISFQIMYRNIGT